MMEVQRSRSAACTILRSARPPLAHGARHRTQAYAKRDGICADDPDQRQRARSGRNQNGKAEDNRPAKIKSLSSRVACVAESPR